jgi:hypothetical protein
MVTAGANGHEPRLAKALELVRACGLKPHDAIIDVGGAAACLVEALIDMGYTDLTVVDAASEPLWALRRRLGERADCVTLVHARLIDWHPPRRYTLWHDRELFHSFVHPEERQQYVELLQQALLPEGHLVIATVDAEEPGGEGTRARYSAATLAEVLGSQFELAEHAVVLHRIGAEAHPYLHCRFRRHAPRMPG